MEVMILDPAWQDEIIRSRSETKSDRWDEVWEGIYLVSPLANNEHQLIASRLNTVLGTVIDFAQLGIVCQGVNVSDRDADWTQNYRCPDVVVYLNGNSAVDRETHWVGGPDFAVEVISKGDRARSKLDFFAKVGTRELLIVDRFPWALELYRLSEGVPNLAGTSEPMQSQILTSQVLPPHASIDPRRAEAADRGRSFRRRSALDDLNRFENPPRILTRTLFHGHSHQGSLDPAGDPSPAGEKRFGPVG